MFLNILTTLVRPNEIRNLSPVAKAMPTNSTMDTSQVPQRGAILRRQSSSVRTMGSPIY